MKIESVYVENFGKLHEFKYDFDSGINVIKEDNGWGKSTLAAFIRAMFYGFEGEGKQKVTDNERKRFKPWQGGAFGGNLTFELKGKRYRIERTFGPKQAEDTFKLFDADKNIECNDFSDKIGQEMFHINSASFMNTVFVSQNDSATSYATDDISTRIGNINDTIDLNKFEAADGALKDALNKLSTSKTGKRGKLKASISEVKARINAASGVEKAFDETLNRIDEREGKLKELRAEEKDLNLEKSKAGKAAAKAELKKRYEDLLNDLNSKKADLDTERSYFKGEVPEKARMKQLRDAADEMSNAQAVIDSSALTEANRSDFSRLSDMFKNGVPEGEKLKNMSDKARQIEELKAKNEKLSLNEDEERRFANYERYFFNEENPVETARELGKEWGDRPDHIHKAEMYEADAESRIRQLAITEKSLGSAFMFFAIVSGLSFVFAAGAAIYGMLLNGSIFATPLGGYLFVTGIAVFIIALLFALSFRSSLKKKTVPLREEIDELNDKAAECRDKADAIKERVTDYLKSHGAYSYDDEIGGKLFELARNAGAYEDLLEKRKNSAITENNHDIVLFEKELKEYLAGYSVDFDGKDATLKLSELRSDAERYLSLKRTDEEFRRAEATFAKLKESIYEQLRAFSFEPLMKIKDQIEEISAHLDTYSSKEHLVSDALERKNRFEQENNVAEIMENDETPVSTPDELNERTDDLNARIEEITALINTDRANLNSLKERMEQLSDDKETLEEFEEELKKAEEDADVYSKTKQFLNDARDNLTMRYIGPLKEGFDKYYGIIGDDYDDYNLDVNLVLSKSEQGASRDKDLLSNGYRDLCGFCLRLSMADAMYKGEKPMLIFDDPFVNLDDNKMAGASKLLDEVKKHYQVIYLTCRENRL